MKAKDIMSQNVIAVGLETPVDEIARLLVSQRIGGVPVINQNRHVIGIVNENDLFLKEKGMPFSAVQLPTLFKRWVEPEKLAEIYADAHLHTAADVMDEGVICVDLNADVAEIAWIMAQKDLRRVPVVENKVLVGIISRLDIIRSLTMENEEAE